MDRTHTAFDFNPVSAVAHGSVRGNLLAIHSNIPKSLFDLHAVIRLFPQQGKLGLPNAQAQVTVPKEHSGQIQSAYPHFQLTETGMVIIMLSALPLCGCIVVPIGLIGSILQIIRCVRHRKQTGTRPPVGLIVWAVLGPVVCLALLMAAAVVHVELTGGV